MRVSISSKIELKKMDNKSSASSRSPGDVESERLKNTVDGFKLLDPTLMSDMFDLLASQCQSEIKTKQERHRELNTKCAGLDLAKQTC